MEYLLMGRGSLPVNEMRAVVDELVEANGVPVVNVLESDGEYSTEASKYFASKGADVYFFDNESPDPDVVLLQVSDENFEVDEYWTILDSLKGKVKVYAFNEQMYEIVPEDEHDEDSSPPEEPEPLHAEDEAEDDAPELSTQPSSLKVFEDSDVLREMKAGELREVAKNLGVEPDDWRSKGSMIDAIESHLNRVGREMSGAPSEEEEEVEKVDATEAPQEADVPEETGVDMAELRSFLSDAALALTKAAALLGD